MIASFCTSDWRSAVRVEVRLICHCGVALPRPIQVQTNHRWSDVFGGCQIGEPMGFPGIFTGGVRALNWLFRGNILSENSGGGQRYYLMFCQMEFFQTMNGLEIESRRLCIVVFGDGPCLRLI